MMSLLSVLFKRRALSLIPALLVLVFGAACTNKKVSRTEHKDRVETIYNYAMQTTGADRAQAIEALSSAEANVRSLVNEYQSRTGSLSIRNEGGAGAVTRLSGADSSALLESLIGPQDVGLAEPVSLEVAVLSTDFIRAPEVPVEAYTKKLEAFNMGFYLLLTRGENSAELDQLKERYHDSLHYGCQPENLDGCIHLSHFRRDHLTALILMELINSKQSQVDEQKAAYDSFLRENPNCSDEKCLAELNRRSAEFYENVAELYRGLTTIFELKNTQPNLDLVLKYVKYSQYYTSMINASATGSRRTDLNRQHQNRLGIALTQIRDQKEANPEAFESYCTYLTSSRPYAVEFLQALSTDRTTLRGYFNEYMACATRSNQPEVSQFSEDFSSYVQQWQSQVLAEYEAESGADASTVTRRPGGELSYFQALEELKRSPFMLTNLGVKSSFEIEGAVFYAIEMFYYGYIDVEIARTILNRARAEIPGASEKIAFDKKVLEFVQHYIQVQTLYTLRDTYIVLANLFQEEVSRTNGLASGTFAEVIRKLNNSTDVSWTQLKVKSSLMLGLVESAFDSNYRFPRQGTEAVAQDYKNLRAILAKDTLNSNLDYLATMPVMFAISYYMSKAQGNIQVHIPWITRTDSHFSVDARNALVEIIQEDTGPKFRPVRYGNMTFSFNDMQKFHSLDMALRSGLFELFPLSMLMEDQARVTTLKEKFKDTLGEVNDPNVFNEYLFFFQFINDWMGTTEKSLTDTIEQLDRITRDPRFKDNFLQICENPLEAFVQFEHNSLASRTLLDSNYIGSVLGDIYSKSIDTVGRLRVRFEYISELSRLLSEYFASAQNISPEKKTYYQQIIAGINEEVEGLRSRERAIWRKVFYLDREIVGARGNCIERIFKAEVFRQNTLYSENMEFYKNIHAAMTVLRLPVAKSGDATRAGLMEALRAWASNAATQTPAGYDAKSWRETVTDIQSRGEAVIADVYDTGLIDKTLPNPGQSRLSAAVNDLFGIHNRYQAPYFGSEAPVGYLVYDLEDFDTTGKAVKRLNEISGEEFLQGKWDTLVRLRTQLKELRVDASLAEEFIGEIPGYGNGPGESREIGLGENVMIELGSLSELERQTFYRESKKSRMVYSLDPAVFVAEAMRQFGGDISGGQQYVSWHNQFRSGISEINYRKRMLETALRHGVIETADTDRAVCPRDIWGDVESTRAWHDLTFTAERSDECQAFRVTVRDVAEQFISYVQYMKLNRDTGKPFPGTAELGVAVEENWDANLLTYLDRETRMGGLAESWFRYNDLRNSQDWTWFDQWYRTTLSSFRARNAFYQTVDVDYIEGALDYTHIYKNTLETQLGSALIPLNPSVSQILRDRYRELIVRHIDLLDEARAYIRYLEDSQKENFRQDLGPVVFQRMKQTRQGEIYVQALGDQWRFVNVRPRTGGERAGTPILLLDEEGAERWSENYILTFMVDKAGCHALPRNPKDPDYALFRDAFTQADATRCRSSLFPAWNQQRARIAAEKWNYKNQMGSNESGASE